jgi:zinc transport system substrate-binding protein
MRSFLLMSAALILAAPAEAAPKVIASVMPVHGIVSAVMGDLGEPDLLLKGSMSEHRATFTPLQVSQLGKADLVFIIGHGLEAKLAQMSGSEAVNGKTFIELSEAPGVKTLKIRQGGAWEAHDHAHDEDTEGEEDHGEERQHENDGVLTFDPHVWLDPSNAKAMAEAVAAELSKSDPPNAAIYAANSKAFAASLDGLTRDIAAGLAPVKDQPYIVFHDAYQYFERRFGLNAAGAISDVSARAPSAQRLKEIRTKIATAKAVCVFREPQYDSKVVTTVIEGTGAREGVLDPLGADLTPGRDSYQLLLRDIGKSLANCLGG